MDKNELMEMARGLAICTSKGFVEIGESEICLLANAILERAAVECDKHEYVASKLAPEQFPPNHFSSSLFFDGMEQSASLCASYIRSLKIKDE